MSQERAMAELFHCAGTQFDPALVQKFAEFHEGDVSELRREVAGRWMRTLDPDMVNSYWELNCVPSHAAPPTIDDSFQAQLLDNMYDAVVFIDVAGKIKLWNHGAERLSGHRRGHGLPAAMDPGNALHDRREGASDRDGRVPRDQRRSSPACSRCGD